MSKVSARVLEWVRRYGPAELLSLLATVGAAAVATRSGGNGVAVALAATWAGNIAYFGLILAQDVATTRRNLLHQGRAYSSRTLGLNLRALVVEFGAAEALDSLLIRPALMYLLPRWVGDVGWGVVLAKFAADVTFYVPAIISYELSKNSLRKF